MSSSMQSLFSLPTSSTPSSLSVLSTDNSTSTVNYLLNENKQLKSDIADMEKFASLRKMCDGKMTTSEVSQVMVDFIKMIKETYSDNKELVDVLHKTYITFLDKWIEKMKEDRKVVLGHVSKKRKQTTEDSDKESKIKLDDDQQKSTTRRTRASEQKSKQKISVAMRLECIYDDDAKGLAFNIYDAGSCDITIKPKSLTLCSGRSYGKNTILSEKLEQCHITIDNGTMKAFLPMSRDEVKNYKIPIVFVSGSTGVLRHVPLCFKKEKTTLLDWCTKNSNGSSTSIFSRLDMDALLGSSGNVDDSTNFSFLNASSRKEYVEVFSSLRNNFSDFTEDPKAKDFPQFIGQWSDFLNDKLTKK